MNLAERAMINLVTHLMACIDDTVTAGYMYAAMGIMYEYPSALGN